MICHACRFFLAFYQVKQLFFCVFHIVIVIAVIVIVPCILSGESYYCCCFSGCYLI
jgi:uncharacterized membrane protein